MKGGALKWTEGELTQQEIMRLIRMKGLGNKHDLPVEAHSSEAYIQLYPDGNFKMLRFYDKEHYLTFEVGYHMDCLKMLE